jgi:hypothetical protein
MEITRGISLYRYLYLKLAKHHVSLIIFYDFSSTKSENRRVEQVLPGGGEFGTSVGESGGERGERMNMVQMMYTHVNKCKK